ncbi:MAG TPA: nuclear transport factor 2 family protein [Puia sp.]|jgi:uncharacterized protein (TIGR02246 family)|nr:nuclear transport factor 2 family protein [Puia sp.]
MKIIFSFLLMMILQNAFSQHKDVEEIKKLNYDWINCYVTKDIVTYRKIFADDFLLISPGGKKFSKEQTVNNLNNQQITSTHIDSVDVRLLTNDVGILTGYITFVTKDGGKNVTGRTCYQDIYIKRKGRWYAVSAHVTLIN